MIPIPPSLSTTMVTRDGPKIVRGTVVHGDAVYRVCDYQSFSEPRAVLTGAAPDRAAVAATVSVQSRRGIELFAGWVPGTLAAAIADAHWGGMLEALDLAACSKNRFPCHLITPRHVVMANHARAYVFNGHPIEKFLPIDGTDICIGRLAAEEAVRPLPILSPDSLALLQTGGDDGGLLYGRPKPGVILPVLVYNQYNRRVVFNSCITVKAGGTSTDRLIIPITEAAIGGDSGSPVLTTWSDVGPVLIGCMHQASYHTCLTDHLPDIREAVRSLMLPGEAYNVETAKFAGVVG